MRLTGAVDAEIDEIANAADLWFEAFQGLVEVDFPGVVENDVGFQSYIFVFVAAEIEIRIRKIDMEEFRFGEIDALTLLCVLLLLTASRVRRSVQAVDLGNHWVLDESSQEMASE